MLQYIKAAASAAVFYKYASAGTLLVLAIYAFIYVRSRAYSRLARNMVSAMKPAVTKHLDFPSAVIKGMNWSTYRWAAISRDQDKTVQTFSFTALFASRQDPLYPLYSVCFPSPSQYLIEVTTAPLTQPLYAAVVTSREVAQFRQSFAGSLNRFAPSKLACETHQAYENCAGLCEHILSGIAAADMALADIAVVAHMGDRFVLRGRLVETPAFAVRAAELALDLAHSITDYRLSDVQKRQASKANEAADREDRALSAQRAAESKKEQSSNRLDALHEELKSATLSDAERRRIEAKIKSLTNRQRAAVSRKLGASLFGEAMLGGKAQGMVVK